MSMTREELQDAARKAFGATTDGSNLASNADECWALISELGFFMLTVPEELGGLGMGHEAVGAIQFEMGRALVRGASIGQLVAIEALCRAPQFPNREDFLARAMSGERMTAPLYVEGPSVSADQTSVTGIARAVPDADISTHIFAVAEGCEAAILVPLETPGVSLVETPMWDETRRMFDVHFDEVALNENTIIAIGDSVRPIATRLSMAKNIALAADSLGGAEMLLDLTIEYLKTRRQFDRPLALFQALKHRVADMKIKLGAAQALFWSRATDAQSGALAIGAMKAHATRIYAEIAEDAVQLHGGIGLTSEYYCHLFLKRAMLNMTLGGDVDFWQEALGRETMAALAS